MLLTDEKIKDIANETLFNLLPADELILFARAIEAAVLEAQKGQEPVAWMHHISDNEDREHVLVDFEPTHCMSVYKGDTPLYAAPVVQPDRVKDAERYRYIRSLSHGGLDDFGSCVSALEEIDDPSDRNKVIYRERSEEEIGEGRDAWVDAMIAAAEGKK